MRSGFALSIFTSITFNITLYKTLHRDKNFRPCRALSPTWGRKTEIFFFASRKSHICRLVVSSGSQLHDRGSPSSHQTAYCTQKEMNKPKFHTNLRLQCQLGSCNSPLAGEQACLALRAQAGYYAVALQYVYFKIYRGSLYARLLNIALLILLKCHVAVLNFYRIMKEATHSKYLNKF